MFQYCEDSPFVVESGEVTTPEGQVLTYPTLNYRKEVVETAKVNSLVGNSNLSSLFNSLLGQPVSNTQRSK